MKYQTKMGVVITFALVNALMGCGFRLAGLSQDLGHNLIGDIGCNNFRSQTFDTYYKYLNRVQARPDLEQVKKAIASELSIRLSAMPSKIAITATEAIALSEELATVFDQALTLDGNGSGLRMIQQLIKLETGSHESADLKKMGLQLEASFFKIEQSGLSQQLNCDDQGQKPGLPFPSDSNWPLITLGARNTFATAYQSCEALQRPDMNLLIQDLQGVEKDSSPDGVGYGRKYTDIPLLQRTHYYVSGIQYQSGCLAVKNRPLVYDYGGEPAWDGQNNLDFFHEAGEGGPALGVDCSAFISTAIGHAGLRYRPGLENKPIYSRRNSSDFLNPEANGLACFSRITVGSKQSILVGDILAIQGHVVLIDRASEDPFGLEKVSNVADCQKLSVANFNFTIMQSSPSKNGIGINKFIAKDYLLESERMRDAFLKYAKAACLSRFDGRSRRLVEPDVSVIRHLGTPECIAGSVNLIGQSCVQDCDLSRAD